MKATMKNIIRTFIVISLTSSFIACGKSESPLASNDPLASFKLIADQCQKAVSESDRTWPGKNGGFGRTVITPIETSYDVKKTDSLVSPHVGYINLRFTENTRVADTEEALRESNGRWVITENNWKLTYALQDGKWKLQQSLYSFALPNVNIPEGEAKPSSFSTLVGRVPEAVICDPI